MTKSQLLKEKIIKEYLPNFSVDPCGGYVDAKELSEHVYNSVNDYYFRFDASSNPNWQNEPKSIIIDPEHILSEQDNQEICRVMVEGIKEHANEWKIEQEGELKIIKHISGKKHYEKGFEREEWVEIENALKNQEKIPSSPSNQEQQSQEEQPPKEIKHMGYIYHRGSKY